MKKFYALAVVAFFVIGSAAAQNLYWIGPTNGDWSNNANWSTSPGGPSAGTFPQAITDNAVFSEDASVRISSGVSAGGIIINSVYITGTNTVVKITGTGGGGMGDPRLLKVNSTTTGLSIAAGCRLENSTTTGSNFDFAFGDNSKASISGDWLFTGDPEDYAYFTLPISTGQTTSVIINSGGSMTIGANTVVAPNELTGDDYLVFNSGSSLNLLGSLPVVPAANYATGSTINITGVTSDWVSFEESGSVGTINYNCPSQNNGSSPVYLGLLGITVKGNLNILNTNNNELVLISYFSSEGLPSRTATINGNLNIQGNSRVAVAHNDGPEVANTLNVLGNLTANGTSLSLYSGTYISSQRTKLAVGGHIQHTAGTFTAASTVTNQTTDLYVLELNGDNNQNISSVTETFDNAGNQVTLRMNNSSGATLLTSLQIGRIDFSSPNKGVLTTGANTLFINNTTPNSVASIVVNSPSNSGYVNGTVRRRSLSTEPLTIPTGAAAGYRPATLIPSAATLTVFEATHYNNGYINLNALSPLTGVSPDYYWIINRISGAADAAVQLSLPGEVTGSQSNYALVVAKYNGSDWVNERGTTGTVIVPGNANSGTVRSQVQTSFSPYTIGYGLASALPTHLVSFTGKKAPKETIELKWKITDNSTPEVFEVTRSADGVNFAKIGSVAGAEYVRSYEFADNSILAGNNYYRLRMLDKDGSVTFSTIIVVSNGAQGTYLHSVTPSVVHGRTKLNIQSSANANMQLVVTDINGRIVHRQNVSVSNGNQDVWLDAARFAPGAFQVTGYVNGVKTATLRFIKL